MDDKLALVQFMHPGPEHQPQGRCKPWNKGPHRRTFLRQSGCAILRPGETWQRADLLFWGEWESEGEVIERISAPLPNGPRWIIHPFVRRPAKYTGLQNTDPFVFGDHFLYTGCQQWTHTAQQQLVATQLRYLSAGSVILFGSYVQRQFHLDTVFVVKQSIDHNRTTFEDVLHGEVDELYFLVTLYPWYQAGTSCATPECLPAVADTQTFRLYKGATYTDPIGGMFSYFPCLPYTPGTRGFARPVIQLDDVLTPTLKQGKRITSCATIAQARSYWDRVVAQVSAQGLHLGVHADLPREDISLR